MPQNIFTHNIGKIRCTVISDGVSQVGLDSAVATFPAIPENDLRAAFNAAVGEGGNISFSMNDLLIQTPERTILVDTGVGPSANENTGQLYEQLRSVIDPADIDTVFITHC